MAADDDDVKRFTNPMDDGGDDGDEGTAAANPDGDGRTPGQLKTAQYLLVACGCGTRMTWYAINVAIAYFSDMYGNEMYPMLLLSYNLSATVLVLGQATLDKRLIARFGVRRLFTVRVNFAMISIMLIAATMPFVPEWYPGQAGEMLVLILVFLRGAMDYLASVRNAHADLRAVRRLGRGCLHRQHTLRRLPTDLHPAVWFWLAPRWRWCRPLP